MDSIDRRGLLSLIVASAIRRSDTQLGRSGGHQEAADEFDPSVHGLGFANWEGDTGQTIDGGTFEYEPATVSIEDVRRAIDESWSTALSEAQAAITTRIVYSWIGGNAATNGHCYGMTFAADGYFQEPETLPAGADDASQISRPTGPYKEVGDRIRELQTSQLLRAEAWWFAFLGLQWGLADHVESVALAAEAIDETGTAGIALDGEWGAHQVLARGYEREGDRTTLSLYDPNFPATHYREAEEVVTVDRETGDLVDVRGYDSLLYLDPEMDQSVLDRVTEGKSAVLDRLSNAVFLALDAPGSLTVSAPDGAVVDRPTAEYADPERAPYSDAVVVVGAGADDLEVSVDAEAGAEYTLRALGVSDGELVLDTELSDTIDDTAAGFQFAADEAGNVTLRAVEGAGAAADEAAEETRSGSSRVDDTWWLAAGAGAGALGAGAGYRYLRGRGDEEE